MSRTRRQAAWFCENGADVLVLTEVSAGESGDVLAQLLVDADFGVVLPEPSGDDRYRVLVASRGVDPAVVDVGAGALRHRCVAARIGLPAGEIGVTGLYVPSRGSAARRNVDKRAFQERVAAVLPTVAAWDVPGPVVIAGDLNVLEPCHKPRYAVFRDWEYDFYRAFSRTGFEDAFRLVEPDAMDYSWFGRPSGDGGRNRYRFDHAFVSRSHRSAVVACSYDHSVRTAGLTDHSAMTVTLDLTGV
ncbi:endonuclease [Amycolatopsis sp. lyj-108]|uniref:endonuclease n=1 Tax=Amycolatopsis sp. lyj-108 TaxID=2789286 RepID=UPI00397A63C0